MSDDNTENLMRIARDLYAVYCASSGGKNYQGLPCPAWGALTEAVRGHWNTVARRVVGMVDAVAGIGATAREVVLSIEDPGDEVLGHLPDVAGAVETWRSYASTIN